jgi:restriction endonuclease S subunit
MKWQCEQLGSIAGVLPGFAFKSQDMGSEGMPVIRIGDIDDSGRVDGVAALKIPASVLEQKHTKYFLKRGDIVLSMTGEGKLGIVVTDEPLLLNQRVALIRANTPEDQKFIWFALGTANYSASFSQLAAGAAQQNISGGQLEKMLIPFPPANIRQRIAEFMAAYDDLIENNRRRIALLEESARLLYREWFVRLRFPGHEHTRIVNGVPEGWKKVTLGELATKIGSGVTPRGGDASYLTEGTPLIRSMNIYDDRFDSDGLAFISDEQAARMSNVTVQSRDILINITGASVARCCMAPERFVPARVNQHVMIIRVDPSKAPPCFVHAAINSEERKRQLLSYAQKGSTREALTKETLSNFEITIPSPDLVAQFGDIAECSFLQRETLSLQNQKLRTARDLLLPKLMSGEIEV